ncbi:MAG: hypothetical protein QN183_03885 [Armatimonadota bacterium]|nr:hypothetical protein [Armatimonadota bacterium]
MVTCRRLRREPGFALPLVLVTSLLVGLMGIGVFSVVMSDLHGAVANRLAIQTLNVAEAGVAYAISQLYDRAVQTTPPWVCAPNHSNDECWTGSGTPIAFGPGVFQVAVRCTDGAAPGATGCQDNEVRHVIATSSVGRARRRIEVWVRRSPPGGDAFGGFCGRRGVRLDQGTSVTADVASNRDISVAGPRRNPGTIQARDDDLAAPPGAAGFTPTAIDPDEAPRGLTGTYSWKVTFVTAAGAESAGSPATGAVALSNQSGSLTNIPLGAAAIVKRRVYRTRAGQAATGPWFFVGEIPDNSTQTYLDTRVDGELIHQIPTAPSPPAPASAPAAAPADPPVRPPGLTGRYTYKVTYVYRYPGSTTAEIESVGSSPASPAAGPLDLNGQYTKLTGIPESATVLKRRIYRRREDGTPNAPWRFVAEIAPRNDQLDDLNPNPSVVERGYIDKVADTAVIYAEPRAIFGNAFAGRDVNCSQGCAAQVDGVVREHVREVLCAPFVPPPCTPSPDPNNDAPLRIVHSEAEGLVKELRYDEVHPGAGQRMTISTPDNPAAELHIHATSVIFERDAVLAISGRGKVYFHVGRTFRLGQRSWFGVDDTKPGALLVWPGDRIQVLSCASDPSYEETGVASIWWDQENRVSAVVFAPRANISINQAGEFTGALLGQYIHINQGVGYVLDPGGGVDARFLRAAYQIIDRWYDNPRF